ncbi:MAG: glycosyltransferase family 2 protein [Candidatus Levyibacteriota bacterium]|jgi:glycosyltransferase involved in cell wall biosynthesis
MNKKPQVSFFCPAYNDEKNLPILIPKTFALLKDLCSAFEIVIVVDGSPDNTGYVADTLAKQYPNVKVVHHKTNQGYGGALKSGFLNAKKYRYIFYTDGDNQYDVNVLKKMLPYLKNYDAIVGKRTNRALKFRRRIQTSFYNWLIRFLFHLDNQDINCAIRLFKRSAINRIDIANISASAFFPAQLLLALYKNGAKIKEANVKHYPRRFGKESGGKINVIIPTILDMFNYYFAFHSSRALDKD